MSCKVLNSGGQFNATLLNHHKSNWILKTFPKVYTYVKLLLLLKVLLAAAQRTLKKTETYPNAENCNLCPDPIDASIPHFLHIVIKDCFWIGADRLWESEVQEVGCEVEQLREWREAAPLNMTDWAMTMAHGSCRGSLLGRQRCMGT